MKETLVSIIIPCYNAEKFIEITLHSVLWQTHINWECILVDDGSTDLTSKIINNFVKKDSRFNYYYQENSGPSVARNNGVKYSHGEYIQFLDADDVLLPQRLEKCLQCFSQHATDVVYSDFASYHGNGKFFKMLPGKIPTDDIVHAMLFDLNVSFAVLTHSMLFKRSVIEAHPFDVNLPTHGEDQDCWIRIALSGATFFYVDDILVLYNFVPGNLTSNEVKLISSKITLLQKYQSRSECQRYSDDFIRSILYLNQRLVIGYFMEKKFSRGYRVLIKVWKKSKLSDRMKMLVWFFLMILFSKGQTITIREWVVNKTFIKWGAWKSLKAWNPPSEVNILFSHYE